VVEVVVVVKEGGKEELEMGRGRVALRFRCGWSSFLLPDDLGQIESAWGFMAEGSLPSSRKEMSEPPSQSSLLAIISPLLVLARKSGMLLAVPYQKRLYI
jgi:hypothetical protein